MIMSDGDGAIAKLKPYLNKSAWKSEKTLFRTAGCSEQRFSGGLWGLCTVHATVPQQIRGMKLRTLDLLRIATLSTVYSSSYKQHIQKRQLSHKRFVMIKMISHAIIVLIKRTCPDKIV